MKTSEKSVNLDLKELVTGIEPVTYALRMRCSAS